MQLSPLDLELLAAWDKLAARYPSEKRKVVMVGWGHSLKGPLLGWEYIDTHEFDGEHWHTFVCGDHPVFGRVSEMVPASSSWLPPVPSTWRIVGAIW